LVHRYHLVGILLTPTGWLPITAAAAVSAASHEHPLDLEPRRGTRK